METPVGDRYVLDALDERRPGPRAASSRATSSSGDLATTGDGVLTGLMLADLVVRAGAPLAELLDGP